MEFGFRNGKTPVINLEVLHLLEYLVGHLIVLECNLYVYYNRSMIFGLFGIVLDILLDFLLGK